MTQEWNPNEFSEGAEYAEWDSEEFNPEGKKEKGSKKKRLQDLSLLEQVGSGAIGAFETPLSLGTGLGGMIAGGLHGAGKLIMGDGMDEATRAFQETSDALTYNPRTVAGSEFVEGLGHAYEGVKEAAGDWLAFQARRNARPGMPETARMTPEQRAQIPLDPEVENRYRSGGEFAFDALANALPPAAGLASIRGRRARKAAEAKEFERGVEEQGQINEMGERMTTPPDWLPEEFAPDFGQPANVMEFEPGLTPRGVMAEIYKDQPFREFEGQKPLDASPEAPVAPADMATTDLYAETMGTGARDRLRYRDFEDIARDDAHANLDVRPLGPDEMQRGPETPPSLVRDGPGHYEASELQGKPRLKAQLPYEYEGALPFEKVAPEAYRPDIHQGVNLFDEARAREEARLKKEAEKQSNDSKKAVVNDVSRGGKFDFNNPKLAKLLDDPIWLPEVGGMRPELQAKVMREKGNPIRNALEVIHTSSDSPYYRYLAEKLLEDPTFKPDFEIVDNILDKKGEISRAVGDYTPSTHKVRLTARHIGSEQLLLHEAIHARVYAVLEAVRTGMSGALRNMERAVPAARRINELFNSLNAELLKNSMKFHRVFGKSDFLKKLGDEYGMTDVHEFVSEGMSNPEFQALLAQIEVPKHLRYRQGVMYYWDAFVDNVSKLMGLDQKKNSYLSHLLRDGAELISKTDSNARIYYADMLNTDRTLGARIKNAKDLPGAIARDSLSTEQTRKIEDVVGDIKTYLDKGGRLEDFTSKSKNLAEQVLMRMGSMIKKNLLQDTTLGILMSEKGGTGPLIKWTVSQVARIEREMTAKTKAAIDDSIRPFRQMYHDRRLRPELQEMWNIWKEAIGTRDLTRADFKTDRQWDIYSRFQGVHDRILSEVNEVREAAGLKPIQRIPSYFHAAWEGDYRVFGYDSAGNKVWAQGFSTEWEAKAMLKRLRRAHPEIKLEDPVHVPSQDRYRMNALHLHAFEEAIRVMSGNNPATQALRRTYFDVLQHRGFGRTGVHRKNIKGFLGSQDGNIGLRNMERAMDQYVNQAYQYIGNLQKQRVLAELQKVPDEIRGQLPETFEFLGDYVRKAQGARMDSNFIDNLIGDLSKAVGLGEKGPLKAIRAGGQVASMYWLTTPRFLVSQIVQYANIVPKLFQQYGVVDGTKAFFDGIKQAIMPDEIGKEAAQWAARQGYLDATIKNIFGDLGDRPMGSRLEMVKEVASWPAAKIERFAVRLPTFMAFEKSLRPYIRDPETRFREAAEKTDYYMVNYGRTHGAMIYDKAGLLGEAARPLKQYAHNMWGQFFEYAKGVKDKGEIAPLAGFLGVQATMAGLKGMILVAEATAIVTAINAMFDMDIPTPEQLLLKSGVHDALVFGGLSTVLGFDVSSSVSAPGIPNLFTAAPLQFGVKLAADLGNFLVKLAKGEVTDHDYLRAAMAVSPNMMHEWLRNVYTPDGQPVVNPNDRQMRGNFRREEWGYGLSKEALFGVKSIDEAKADAIMRATKQALKLDLQQRINAIDAITDSVMAGQGIPPYLIQRYIEEGGDPRRLGRTIANRMKERIQTGPERMQDVKRPSPGQMHRLEVLREFLDRATEDREGSPDQAPEKRSDANPENRDRSNPGIRTVADIQYRGLDGARVYSDSNPPPSWADRVPPTATHPNATMPNANDSKINEYDWNRLRPLPQTEDWPMIKPGPRRPEKVKT